MRVSADLHGSLRASFEHELWGIKLSHHRIPIMRFLFFHLILTSGESFPSLLPALVYLSNLFSESLRSLLSPFSPTQILLGAGKKGNRIKNHLSSADAQHGDFFSSYIQLRLERGLEQPNDVCI